MQHQLFQRKSLDLFLGILIVTFIELSVHTAIYNLGAGQSIVNLSKTKIRNKC